MKNGQSRFWKNKVHKKKKNKTKKDNVICAGHHYAQTNTNNVNKIALNILEKNSDYPKINDTSQDLFIIDYLYIQRSNIF
jgi:proteasome assembly chaperone (PAC2) family protein